jgi:hypothetical protein
MKDRMKNYGYGPSEFRRTQPSPTAQVKRRAYGGKMIKPFQS